MFASPVICGIVALVLVADSDAERPSKPTAKEALQAFNDLIGPWRATGTPEGSPSARQKGFWQEAHQWEWQFKGADVCLKVAIDKGKYFTRGELRFLPDKEQYEFKAVTLDDQTLTFAGAIKDHTLSLERQDDKKGETQRLVLALIHSNRFLYSYAVKPEDKTLFTKLYQAGAVKEDVPFASPGDASPECIVSGGLGTIKVAYKGQTYYVCCSGCRDAFKDDPEKYIKEYEEKKKTKAKK